MQPGVSRLVTVALIVMVIGVVAGGVAYALGSLGSGPTGQLQASRFSTPGTPVQRHGSTTPTFLATTTTTTTTTPTVPAGPTLVTPAVEQSVIDSTYRPFATALAVDDMSTVKKLTTPSADGALTGAFACGCSPWPPGFTSVAFSAPPQTSYPLAFWAEFTGTNYDSRPLTKEVIFNQSSASAPWLIAYIGSYSGGSPSLAPGSNINEALPFPSSPAEVALEFSTYFHQVDTAGASSSPNATPPAPPLGIGSDQYLTQVVNSSFQGGADDHLQGWTDQFTHRVVDVSPAFEIDTPNDSQAIGACFAESVVDVVSKGSGPPIVQPQDQSAFPTLLAPGTYSTITWTKTIDNCFIDGGNDAYLLTNWGGDVSIVGTP